MNASKAHLPVMFDEIIEALKPQSGKRYLDLTLGAGGHSEGILQKSEPDGELIAFDVDPQAIGIATQRLSQYELRVVIKSQSYLNLEQALEKHNWDGVDGIVVDFGASSMQFDTAERGFSFMQDGPLDMRFDSQQNLNAAEIINNWGVDEMADIFKRYGEEKHARSISRKIVEARPFNTTRELAEFLEEGVGRRSRIHPATRVFQALRIAVNDELGAIEAVLPKAVAALNPGGRFAVLTFHSLEDRIVKHYFKDISTSFTPSPDQPHLHSKAALVKLINRKPMTATQNELDNNPRARSAKLRIIEKC